MSAVFTAYEALSFISIGLLLFSSPAVLLPTKLTKVSPYVYTPTSVSLLISALGRSLLVIPEIFLNKRNGRSGTLCDVDAALTVFATTAVIAHLPLVAFNVYRATILAPPALRLAPQLALLIAAYALAAAPLVAVLVAWGRAGAGADLGAWRGAFCLPTFKWWTAVRMGTLYVPAAIAWGLCVPAALKVTLLASRLATRTEAPSWSLNQLRRKVLVAVTATLGVTIFLMIEGLAGGANGYWPGHSAEALAGATGIIVFLVVLHRDLLKMWARWLRIPVAPADSMQLHSDENLPLPELPPHEPPKGRAFIDRTPAAPAPSVASVGTVHILPNDKMRQYLDRVRTRDAESSTDARNTDGVPLTPLTPRSRAIAHVVPVAVEVADREHDVHHDAHECDDQVANNNAVHQVLDNTEDDRDHESIASTMVQDQDRYSEAHSEATVIDTTLPYSPTATLTAERIALMEPKLQPDLAEEFRGRWNKFFVVSSAHEEAHTRAILCGQHDSQRLAKADALVRFPGCVPTPKLKMERLPELFKNQEPSYGHFQVETFSEMYEDEYAVVFGKG